MRDFNADYIDKDFTEFCPTINENVLYYNCKFKDIHNVTFKDCVMTQSELVAENIREVLGVTITLDCNSFRNVKLPEFVLDLFLLLLTKTRGNSKKRKQILDIVGKEKAVELLKSLDVTE